ncbi:type I pullulanase [Paenibacillus solani]|uniref:pullulanase n=1 Tax=Paenibacillus solani TaxID=1705565 RepID=A0A0M1P875_9BACL|nr:type I pullulanase [Paenibacillus solani]KOR90612.1 alpha-dextrin endo-1,6-alpha-glucosidase [Paenibacillus solani]
MDMIKSCTSIRLGAIYRKEGTTFQVWAPEALSLKLALYECAGEYNEQGFVTDHEGGTLYSMDRNDEGVWSVVVNGDLHGTYYMYRIESTNGVVSYAVDPYATAVSANGCRGAVVDLAKSNPPGWEQDMRPKLLKPTDSVLYELHVRDFSIHSDSGMKYRGKYKAFTESGLRDSEGNAIGLDHLVELGVTHVHLLPIFDFRTVNELDGYETGSLNREYNWGYDPQNYNVPEGSYSTDPMDPIVRIRELKEMILALHARGIRVVMDVVYNHTYTVDDGPFERLAPGYFYRKDVNGNLSNGSGVGNELATEKPMVRKYIKDSLRYWAEEYHIDGFRFDLMALIDRTTMKEIVSELRREVDSSLLFYGEPWTGGMSPLVDQTVKESQKGQGFAVFNDHFRHAIKGDNDGRGRGFATGEPWYEAAIVEGIMGSIHDFALDASETVNYVTVHDNLNLWDKILVACGMDGQAGLLSLLDGKLVSGSDVWQAVAASKPYAGIPESKVMSAEPIRRSLLANGIVLLAQGIPLLHAGDELLRTKYGDHNSYRSGDAINAIRWSNKQRFRSIFDYYKGLIALRKAHPAFRMTNREEIEANMEVLRSSDRMVAYRLTNDATQDDWGHIVVIFNGNEHEMVLDLPPTPYRYNIVVDDCRAGTETIRVLDQGAVTVPGLSIMVLREDPTHMKEELTKIVIDYERQDQAYDGWNVWVWGTGVQDGSVPFSLTDSGTGRAVFYAASGTKRVGCIVRLNDWEDREGEHDWYIDISPDEREVRCSLKSVSDHEFPKEQRDVAS